ncbi:uncharacterized protein LOC143356993 [Halictus rubicundus]|uniref:uncharacterized protein LOC143356993 n=1 Tax=Halictus rubicundus TaxID=77578 RepID=UPI004036FC5E
MSGMSEGATFDSIVDYVTKNMRITRSRAGYMVMEVLKVGVALGRIKRTPRGTYILASDTPASPATQRIRQPRFSDNSNDEISTDDSL